MESLSGCEKHEWLANGLSWTILRPLGDHMPGVDRRGHGDDPRRDLDAETAAMAVIELPTGERLDGDFLGMLRPALIIDQPVRVPLEPVAFGHFDADLDARLHSAPETV